MRPDANEQHHINLFSEYRSVIARHVDATTAGKSFVHRVVVEEWVKCISTKQLGAFKEFLLDPRQQFVEFFLEPPMEPDAHAR